MPDCELTQTIAGVRLQHAVGVQQRLGDVQLRLQVDRHDRVPAGGVHVDQQLVAGDAGVVDDDVDPAVPLPQVLDQPLRRVVGGDVELQRRPADLVGDVRPAPRPAAGMSTATTWAPSRAMTFAIAAPMPRAAPVTTATLPASGCSASSPAGRSAGRQRDRLAVDVGRAAGQEEPHRRGERALGAGRHVAAGSPSTRSRSSLPMDRTSPSSACRAAACAGDRRPSAGRRARAPGRGGPQPLDRRGEEVVRGGQVGRRPVSPVASRTTAAELLAVRRAVGRDRRLHVHARRPSAGGQRRRAAGPRPPSR